MSRAYSDIAFTPAVRDVQTRLGSRAGFERRDDTDESSNALTEREADFIHARDGFYQATVSQTGWPYVQFRGGPAGFLKVLDARTIGYADFRGNVQYISVGNLQGNDRVSIILMDYRNRRRLKILGRVRLVSEREDRALMARLELPHYRARVERAVVITVEAYDWNCPQHITPRFTEAEIEEDAEPLRAELARLQHELSEARAQPTPAHAASSTGPGGLGRGPLALIISGARQLTPRVRAYELRSRDATDLPAVQAGAHIDVPVRLANGSLSTRRYSITSHPQCRELYEIAVLREEAGSGGSTAVHAAFSLGMTLNCGLPGNDFPLRLDTGPVVLIAGGIGITPIKAMAQQLISEGREFELHYAVRSRSEAVYLAWLEREVGAALHVYADEPPRRLNVETLVGGAAANSQFYVCGPARLIDAVRAAAVAAGVHPEQIHFERFLAPTVQTSNRPVTVTLKRSRKRIHVSPSQSILEAVEAAGVETPAGCRAGTCGTCAVTALAGDPEHRDSVLSNSEREKSRLMCICVSRARSAELTLDI